MLAPVATGSSSATQGDSDRRTLYIMKALYQPENLKFRDFKVAFRVPGVRVHPADFESQFKPT